ncbi:NACHT domain-containing protein [Anabaena catenula]|uniref:NACHT domain-containing protein n=1 Tax=Anabaena catenula FACHB-362 TaxID=2692877 RepID=A0ABR8J7J3_9NOST|nr:NACHT domain-containing protein [Anabaena catenula]MBD2694343.1 NACHT domain-containing protein [Anabaena catenula FACHB-362]
MFSNINNLQEIKRELADFLVKSGFCALDQREGLCISIEIEANKLNFFNNPNNDTFALQLVDHLFEMEKTTSLKLLFNKLENEFGGNKQKRLSEMKTSVQEEIECKEYKEQTRDAYDNFGQFSFQKNAAQRKKINERELNPKELKQKKLNEKERKGVLQKVNESWIKGFLYPSLDLEDGNIPIINPNREFNLNESYKALKNTQTFEEIGQKQGRTLLILGEAGSGKTIALLQLAERLLEDSKNNSYSAMPIMFNLSSWAENQNIFDWLIDELRDKYQVSQSLSEKWIRGQQLILLLDGLDEVEKRHRNNCVSKLNDFLVNFPQTEVAVCSRLEEYDALQQRLKISSALCLQPYSLEQVYQYLDQYGGLLEALNKLLKSNAELEQFARTPLILYFMSEAYQGDSFEHLISRLQSTSDRNKNLFDDYINRKLRKGAATSEYSQNDVLHWLNWLAKQMSQSVFQIEQIQPQYLPSENDINIYRIAISLILCVILGIIAGTYFIYYYTAFLNNKQVTEINISVQFIAIGLLSGLIYGVIVGLLSLSSGYLQSKRLRKGVISGIIFALSIYFIGYFLHQPIPITPIYLSAIFGGAIFSSIDTSIEPVDSIELDVKRMIKYVGFFGIFGGGTSFLGLYIENPNTFLSDKFYYFIYVTIIFMIVGLFIGGFRVRKNSIDLKDSIPNQGIKRSLRYTVITFCALFFSAMFVGWGMDFSFHFNPVLICLGLAVGLLGGLGANESSGVVCLQHFILRQMLYKKGCIPKNYEKFLNFVSVRRLMNQIGGSYIFFHRMLLEHFARM